MKILQLSVDDLSSDGLSSDDRSSLTRADQVAGALRTSILRGMVKPGEKLDQRQIAAELGVGRASVREALRTLAAEELVTLTLNRGARVTERSIADLQDLQFIRCLLEGAAARRGAPRMDDRRLGKLAIVLEKADKSNDIDEIFALNKTFHGTIYEAFPQPLLIDHIRLQRNKMTPYNRRYLERAGNKEAAWGGHRRIYEACLRRDGKQAEVETINHLEQVFQGIVEAT
jgi:DNA-binding GntR family transcriptional regulator